MKAICVIDPNRAIGLANRLLFRIPSDLKHFKKNTLFKTVIMGRRTLESMPGGRPLKGRNTLVLSSSMPEGLFWMDGSFFARSFRTKESLFDWVKKNIPEEELIVAGGASVYGLFLDDCDELILTEVQEQAEKADAFFPEFSGKFDAVEEFGPVSENGLHYVIRRYRRKNVQER